MCKFIPGSGTQQSRFDTCFLEPSSGGARFCGQHKLPKRDDEQQTLPRRKRSNVPENPKMWQKTMGSRCYKTSLVANLNPQTAVIDYKSPCYYSTCFGIQAVRI